MGNCGACQANATPRPEPVPLCQIRRGYRARWDRMGMSVHVDSQAWTLVVEDAESRNRLYTAHRSGARAAQVAAVEFAIFQVLGPDSRVTPERLAQELHWQEVW